MRVFPILCVLAVASCGGEGTPPDGKKVEPGAGQAKPVQPPAQKTAEPLSEVAKLGPNAQSTQSGLKYEVLKEGQPGTQPKAGDKVSVHYTGWLTNGKKFDSSHDRAKPIEFTLGRGEVIPGWDEGLALMNEGARYKFVIPSNLAYGPAGRAGIPANATLVFDVEFLRAIRPAEFHQPDPEKQQTTQSGLKYEIVQEGEGDMPAAEQGVKLKFAVFTPKGEHLLSTESSGRHLAGQVKGLRLTRLGEKFLAEAALLMKPGSRLVLEVPANLCWGEKRVFPNLPANSTTVWDLELVQINDVPPFDPPVEANQKETPTGLNYEVLSEGTGKTPTRTDSVTVHYSGWLTDGTLFDSSYARGETVTFPLGNVIAGWTEGLQLMKEGAKYRFVIPPRLGYGARDSGPIPANSTLIFIVELIKVE